MEKKESDFAKELRRLRLKGSVRYTQAELAELAGVTASYISQLETGKRPATTGVIRKLCPHLGVSTNHLLSKIGLVEMDLAATFAKHSDNIKKRIPNLSKEQLEEIANYLTYLDFKASSPK